MFNTRLARFDDIKNIFELSNDKDVRKNSLNKEYIKWENHVIWFKDRLLNPLPFYIIEDNRQNFIAQVRFEKENGNVFISLSILKSCRGKGLGTKIIKECTKKSNFKKVYALIKSSNIQSQKAFIKAGYIKDDIKIINNETYNTFVYKSK
ncbi:TPA: GNAT family N-acetyltransferase [Candidatus Galligastranaerophilus faecipullorum]|nr:GNAT family N-acetyltransferase [Candidatus Galligastranaerophilus faecipullorum]